VWKLAKIDFHIPFAFSLLLKRLKISASTENAGCGNEVATQALKPVLLEPTLQEFGSQDSFQFCSLFRTAAKQRLFAPDGFAYTPEL
jgi:hypothetical protein